MRKMYFKYSDLLSMSLCEVNVQKTAETFPLFVGRDEDEMSVENAMFGYQNKIPIGFFLFNMLPPEGEYSVRTFANWCADELAQFHVEYPEELNPAKMEDDYDINSLYIQMGHLAKSAEDACYWEEPILAAMSAQNYMLEAYDKGKNIPKRETARRQFEKLLELLESWVESDDYQSRVDGEYKTKYVKPWKSIR